MQRPGVLTSAPTPVDLTLRALFKADMCYVRRRAQRRRLQAVLATSTIIPIAALWNQSWVPYEIIVAALSAWAALLVLTHATILSELVSYQRIVQCADGVASLTDPLIHRGQPLEIRDRGDHPAAS